MLVEHFFQLVKWFVTVCFDVSTSEGWHDV